MPCGWEKEKEEEKGSSEGRDFSFSPSPVRVFLAPRSLSHPQHPTKKLKKKI